jgi:hypothetical protein
MSIVLRTLIIEDEQPAIDLLQFYLKEIKNVEVLKVCKDGFTGNGIICEKLPSKSLQGLCFAEVRSSRFSKKIKLR